ncbi:hypothetical protein [Streptomyces sp. NPDC002640]
MTRTTPSRPLDIAEAFPELAGMSKVATRLHPRPGAPTVHDSSVGGPLLWPADEPWPEGEPWLQHYRPLPTPAEVRERRALLTQAWARPRRPRESLLTAQEEAVMERLTAGHDPQLLPAGPQPLIPLAQLYARDVPTLPFPEGRDLLQVLWAPSFDIEGSSANVQLRWRTASQVQEVLHTPAEPAYVECDNHLPEPCLLHPEPVREFPPHQELDEDLSDRLETWCAQRSLSYHFDLSVAPGWKAGGWPAPFTFRDPADPDELCCGECGGPVDALLTVDGNEWHGGAVSWRPLEAGPDAEEPAGAPYRTLREPTMITIGRGYTLQLYSCIDTPSHLPRTIMQ